MYIFNVILFTIVLIDIKFFILALQIKRINNVPALFNRSGVFDFVFGGIRQLIWGAISSVGRSDLAIMRDEL